MSKLLWVICSNSIQSPTNNPQGGSTNQVALINPQAILRPEFIPSLFSFAISLAIMGVDVTETHQFDMKITDPNDQTAIEILDQQTPTDNGDKFTPLDVSEQYVIINMMMMNVPLRMNGLFKVTVQIDREEIGHQEILVRAMENPYGK